MNKKLVQFGVWVFVLSISKTGFGWLQTEETRRESVTKAAKQHLQALLEFDQDQLKKTYADEVVLMPGNELLKGSPNSPERSKAELVLRDDLLERLEGKFGNRKLMAPDQMEQFMAVIKFKILEFDEGDLAVDPPDPVATPDGKLHFKVEAGDFVIKVGPEKRGDFLLFQFREIDDQWKVIAELLD